jgi:hypothetical protein
MPLFSKNFDYFVQIFAIVEAPSVLRMRSWKTNMAAESVKSV